MGLKEQKKEQTNKKVLLIVLIIVLSCIAGLLVRTYLSSNKSQIYMFNGNYNKGDKITNEMISAYSIDSSMLKMIAESGDEYITDDNKKDFVDTYLITDVNVNTPALTSYSSKTGGNKLVNAIKDGKVATTVQVDDYKGVSKIVTPGCSYNIYSMTETDEGQLFHLILQGAETVAIKKDDNGSMLALTFLTTPEDAMILQNANLTGQLVFTLINPETYEETEDYFIEKGTEKKQVNEQGDEESRQEYTSNLKKFTDSLKLMEEMGIVFVNDMDALVDQGLAYYDKDDKVVVTADLKDGEEYHDVNGSIYKRENGTMIPTGKSVQKEDKK